MADSPEEFLSSVREAQEVPGGGKVPALLFGDLPEILTGRVPGASVAALPEGLDLPSITAYAAALILRRPAVSAGFSLRTAAQAEAEETKDRRRLLLTAIAGGAAILLAIGALEFSVWAGGRKAAKARALVQKEFTEAAPDVRNVVQAGTQIRERLASVRRQQKELGTDAPSPPEFLFRASQALPPGEVSLREASVEGDRLHLGGVAAEARLVETYRSALAGAFGPGYSVSVQESTGSAQGSSVRFTILVERKGDAVAS
jgi:hypothetical protein